MKLFVKTVFTNLFTKITTQKLFVTTEFLKLYIGPLPSADIFDFTFDQTFN